MNKQEQLRENHKLTKVNKINNGKLKINEIRNYP